MYGILHFEAKFKPYFLFTFLSQRTFKLQILRRQHTGQYCVIWLVKKQVKVTETVSIATAPNSSKYISFVIVCNLKLTPRARL